MKQKNKSISKILRLPSFPMSFSPLSKVHKEFSNFIHFWWFAAPKMIRIVSGAANRQKWVKLENSFWTLLSGLSNIGNEGTHTILRIGPHTPYPYNGFRANFRWLFPSFLNFLFISGLIWDHFWNQHQICNHLVLISINLEKN